jgi:Na+-transporting NADH:ubiquinone oxidoreductase subunit NqrF
MCACNTKKLIIGLASFTLIIKSEMLCQHGSSYLINIPFSHFGATQEAEEIRRIAVQSQSKANISQDLISKILNTKKWLAKWLKG